jgi:hypothetical protein
LYRPPFPVHAIDRIGQLELRSVSEDVFHFQIFGGFAGEATTSSQVALRAKNAEKRSFSLSENCKISENNYFQLLVSVPIHRGWWRLQELQQNCFLPIKIE